jgi:NAD(P)-dependent dehydrogenase (short-subunit alcohol dehydrogenase family)
VSEAPAPPRLHDRTVVIVGADALALEIAHRFVAAGVQRIGLVDHDAERGEKAAETVRGLAPGIWALSVAGDVTVPAEAARVLDELSASLGPADILVTGTSAPATPALLDEIDPADVSAIVAKQLLGPLNMCRAALPEMRAQHEGVIVNLASDAGNQATRGESVIGAAMAGIIMFSKTLAIEAKDDGVRVNAVTPAPLTGSADADRDMAEPVSAAPLSASAALGVTEPSDVAALVVSLCGPAGHRITGQVVSANGGSSPR